MTNKEIALRILTKIKGISCDGKTLVKEYIKILDALNKINDKAKK